MCRRTYVSSCSDSAHEVTPSCHAQVIDARDPLTYRSNDLEQYARDIAPHKGSLLLLNKADLLSAELRTAWADYFDERGVSYVFWSAKAAADAAKQDAGRPSALTTTACRLLTWLAHTAPRATYCTVTWGKASLYEPSEILAMTAHPCMSGRPQPQRPSSSDPRARVLTVDELLLVFEQEAQEAVDRASPQQLELRVSASLLQPLHQHDVVPS